MWQKFINWCKNESATARLQRTIIQGIIGAVIVAVPQVIGFLSMPEWGTALAVAIVMSILSPVMAAIGNKGEITETK